MYHFKIKKQENGGYRFELGFINILIEGYTLNGNVHILSNPNKAIAYFNVGDNIYGISNVAHQYDTVEAFYDDMDRQYKIVSNPLRRSA
jgi:hypothetical protein